MSKLTNYRAFISYSHKDNRWAERIHKNFESYSVPSRLVGQKTSMGVIPKKLSPIFRDREELSVAENLSEAVQTALDNSDCLIILCSPASAKSKWVNKEILTFRELYPDRPVFTAIIGGEPLSSLGGTKRGEECFPPALLEGRSQGDGLEPLAADFRSGGDGFRLALIKLVAGMLGLRLDQIIQRDHQRRQRRVTAITISSAFLSLVMGALALFALSAQSDAEQRRAEAEGLIEFMLIDLKEKLEPLGSLEILDSVGEKVIEYYDGQSLNELPADSLGRRARAFHMLGEIESVSGNMESAYQHFTTAYQATHRLLANNPEDSDRIYEHSQSAYWVGEFAGQQGQTEEREGYWIEYRDLANKLVVIDPENIEWRTELSYSYNNLGVVYLQTFRLQEAMDSLNASLELKLEMLDEIGNDPQKWSNIANTYAWLADTADILEGRDSAIAFRLRQLSVFEDELSEFVDDWNVRRNSVTAEMALARLLVATGKETTDEDLDFARGILISATHEADMLVERDPSNARWRSTAIATRLWLTQVHVLSGDLDLARQAFNEATAYMAHTSMISLDRWEIDRIRNLSSLFEARILFLAEAHSEVEEVIMSLLIELSNDSEWMHRTSHGAYIFASASNTLADALQAQGKVSEAISVRNTLVDTLRLVENRMTVSALSEYRHAERIVQDSQALVE